MIALLQQQLHAINLALGGSRQELTRARLISLLGTEAQKGRQKRV